MNISKIIQEHHAMMIEKGFYDCEECQGIGYMMDGEDCSVCHGSKINSNKNIGELLMLIVSELGEALEAHRNNRFADTKKYDEFLNAKFYSEDVKQKTLLREFQINIKNIFEDEIADVFLRLFDLCGYLEIDTQSEWFLYGYEAITDISENVPSELLNITEHIIDIKKESDDLTSSGFVCNVGFCFAQLNCFCDKFNIPIEKHIKAKMAYNKIRPHKHGKEY